MSEADKILYELIQIADENKKTSKDKKKLEINQVRENLLQNYKNMLESSI